MTPSPALKAQLSEMGKAMLVAGLALLVATVVLLMSAEHDLRSSNQAVQRINGALLQLADIEFLVIGVDYSARGYALTGEPLFFNHEVEKQRDLRLGLARAWPACRAGSRDPSRPVVGPHRTPRCRLFRIRQVRHARYQSHGGAYHQSARAPEAL